MHRPWARYGLTEPVSLSLLQPPSPAQMAQEYLDQVHVQTSTPALPPLPVTFIPLGWAVWWRECIPPALRTQIIRSAYHQYDLHQWRDALCALLAGQCTVTLRACYRHVARDMPAVRSHRLACSQRQRRSLYRVRRGA